MNRRGAMLAVPIAALAAANAAIMVMRGELTAVDARHNRVFVRGPASVEYPFTLKPEAEILDGERAIRTGELRPGMSVSVKYIEQVGQRVAQSVVIEQGA